MTRIDEAFQTIDRADFVPLEQRDQTYIDAPLPIGFGQTISQPSTVRQMFEWLDARTGDKILDIGSGSGWTSALLSHIVGPKGHIDAVELVPELVRFGKQNCEKIGIKNVRFFQAGTDYGLPDQAPYDKILVSAAAETLPEELLGQLRPDGKLVIPVKNNILEITKTTDGQYKTVTHSGFVFVPLKNIV